MGGVVGYPPGSRRQPPGRAKPGVAASRRLLVGILVFGVFVLPAIVFVSGLRGLNANPFVAQACHDVLARYGSDSSGVFFGPQAADRLCATSFPVGWMLVHPISFLPIGAGLLVAFGVGMTAIYQQTPARPHGNPSSWGPASASAPSAPGWGQPNPQAWGPPGSHQPQPPHAGWPDPGRQDAAR